MKRYTVAEYAKLKNTSVQNIYAKIKRNTLKHTTVDNTVYVLIEEDDNSIVISQDTKTIKLNDNINKEFKQTKQELKKVKKLLKQSLKDNQRLQSKIDKNDQYIKQLNKQLNKEKDQSITVLKQFISEQRTLNHQPIVNDDEIVVNEVVKKNKKTKKKNKK